jgi:hypothetical protein
MAYLGQATTLGRFVKLDSFSSSQNGSTRILATKVNGVDFYPVTTHQLLVVRNGQPLEADKDYTVLAANIVFANTAAAPKANITTSFTSITSGSTRHLIVGNTAGVTTGLRVNGTGFAINDVYVTAVNSSTNVTISGANISAISGNITFVDNIFIVSYGEMLNIGIPNDNAVQDSMLQAESVSYNKLADITKDLILGNTIAFGI